MKGIHRVGQWNGNQAYASQARNCENAILPALAFSMWAASSAWSLDLCGSRHHIRLEKVQRKLEMLLRALSWKEKECCLPAALCKLHPTILWVNWLRPAHPWISLCARGDAVTGQLCIQGPFLELRREGRGRGTSTSSFLYFKYCDLLLSLLFFPLNPFILLYTVHLEYNLLLLWVLYSHSIPCLPL